MNTTIKKRSALHRLTAVVLDGISHHVENIRHAIFCRRHFTAVDLLRDSLAYRRSLVDHVQHGVDHMSAAVDEDIVAGELAHIDLGYVRDELRVGRDFGKEAVKRDLSAVFDVDRLDDLGIYRIDKICVDRITDICTKKHAGNYRHAY